MHYRNGREAKNGDSIVMLDGQGKIVHFGVLHDAVPGNDYCNGYMAPKATTTQLRLHGGLPPPGGCRGHAQGARPGQAPRRQVAMAQGEQKCGACQRTTATHAEGCSHIDCPKRHPQMWRGPEGNQGFPGQLAEDRVVLRRSSADQP